jgi:peroxiredoxin
LIEFSRFQSWNQKIQQKMSATIKEGDHLPDAIFMSPTKDGLKPLSTKEVFGGKKVILVAVPGTLLQ